MPMPRKTSHLPKVKYHKVINPNQLRLYSIFVYRDKKHYGFLRYKKSFPRDGSIVTSNTLVKNIKTSSKFIDLPKARRVANRLFKQTGIKTLIAKDDMDIQTLAALFKG